MAGLRVTILSDDEIHAIHDASLAILGDTGVVVRHPDVLALLGENGASVDRDRQRAKLPERLVMDAVARAGKRYVLFGRDPARTARFGYGELNQISSPGQFGWIDSPSGRLRAATLADARQAIRLGDALPNITVVGSMAQPAEISEKYREVALTAELVRGATKPTRTWVYNGRTARYVLEIYRAVAGGAEALRRRPMTEAFLEPISPLQLPRDGLDVDVIGAVGPCGSFLAEEHTVTHYRQELWMPGPVWTRESWAAWESHGRRTMADRLRDRIQQLLAGPPPAPLEEGLSRELERIVEAAKRELTGV